MISSNILKITRDTFRCARRSLHGGDVRLGAENTIHQTTHDRNLHRRRCSLYLQYRAVYHNPRASIVH